MCPRQGLHLNITQATIKATFRRDHHKGTSPRPFHLNLLPRPIAHHNHHTTMNLSHNLEDQHPVELFLTVILFLAHLLIEAWQLLSQKNQIKPSTVSGTITTSTNTVQNQQSSPSIESPTTAPKPIKPATGTNTASQSKTSASSRRNRQSVNSNASSTTTKTSRRKNTTSRSVPSGVNLTAIG